ncbi:MAG: hypothetical protein Hyperionvirus4_28 [Hyperionvirus sp.]|uniref:Right handed beta helix domain-containing protein n=1 Tax=Hyperionvirus sp. TaxID=2487770 RepID=A0A3G5AB52_9VIRU|nr:MAG: hypothetical protein Hyperionvirus4_28 [Hyperionvirus sp.]
MTDFEKITIENLGEESIKTARRPKFEPTNENLILPQQIQPNKNSCCKCNKKSGRCKKIRQYDVGTTGYIISKPGNYCLVEDILFTPTDVENPAILILASNVHLNLNNRDIKGNGARLGIVVTNINVTEHYSNITITNGSISNFYVWSIQAANNGRIDNLNINNINITSQNIPKVINDVVGGIWLDHVRNVIMNKLNFLLSFQYGYAFTQAIRSRNTSYITIEDTNIRGVNPSSTDITGSTLSTGISINFGYSTIIRNTNVSAIVANAISKNAYGIRCDGAYGLNLENCNVQGIINFKEIDSSATGIYISGIFGAIVKDCSVCNLESGGSGDSTGFYCGGETVQYSGCSASVIDSISGNAVGFNLVRFFEEYDGANMIWDNCASQQCHSLNSIGTGFGIFQQASATLKNSISSNNSHYGILVRPTASSIPSSKAIVFKNNVLSNNGVQSIVDETKKNVYIGNDSVN